MQYLSGFLIPLSLRYSQLRPNASSTLLEHLSTVSSSSHDLSSRMKLKRLEEERLPSYCHKESIYVIVEKCPVRIEMQSGVNLLKFFPLLRKFSEELGGIPTPLLFGLLLTSTAASASASSAFFMASSNSAFSSSVSSSKFVSYLTLSNIVSLSENWFLRPTLIF